MSTLSTKIVTLAPVPAIINLVSNPNTATDWLAANGGATLATTQAAGDLPLGTAITTAIKVTSGTSTRAEGTLAETTSYAFITPAAYAVKTGVEFWLRPGTNFLNNEWTVSIYAGATRQPLTTDASAVTYIPNALGKFTTYFDAVASTAYTLRFTRTVNAGTNAGVLNVANVIVGPGIQPQGAVVGEWQSFTPTLGFTASASTGQYRRVGSQMELNLSATWSSGATISFTIPGSLTINTGVFAADAEVGTVSLLDASASYKGYTGSVTVQSSTVLRARGNDAAATASDAWTSSGPVSLGAGDIFKVNATIPISEWAGSGTVNLAQNDVEWASNNASGGVAANTNYTTGTVYGPSGSNFPGATISSTTATTTTGYDVVWRTPIQTGDVISIEISPGGSGWIALGQASASIAIGKQGSVQAGMLQQQFNSTTTRVFFSNAGRETSPTFGTMQGNWTSDISGWLWRVRKSSAGAAVGFGTVSATSSGLMPASNSNLDDATATRLGLKQYLHGTTYNGGNAPTLTTGFTSPVFVRGVFIPYQMQDGAWRLKFNVDVTHASGSSGTFNINGVTTKQTSGLNQAFAISLSTGALDFISGTGFCATNSTFYVSGSSGQIEFIASGDVELNSKPTWAY